MPRAKSPELAILGRALRSVRAERGMSQEEVSYRAGMHRNHVGQCERGELNPTFGTMIRLINALDVTFSEFAQRYDDIRAHTASQDASR